MYTVSMDTKRCVACGKTKPISEFYKHSNKRTGYDKYHSRCKPCKNKYQVAWHRKSPERVARAAMDRREHQARRRREAIAAYGGKCTCCGEDNPAFLTVDHIGGGGNKHRRSLGSNEAVYTWLQRNGYPKDGFQLLCMNCNWASSRNGGVCPHVISRAG